MTLKHRLLELGHGRQSSPILSFYVCRLQTRDEGTCLKPFNLQPLPLGQSSLLLSGSYSHGNSENWGKNSTNVMFLSLSLGAQILRFKTSPSSLTELIEINVEYFPNLQFLGKVAH